MYSESLRNMYFSQYTSLAHLTVAFIHYFCNQLGITTTFINSSTISLGESFSSSTEKVVNLCKKTNISSLYDAYGAQAILDPLIFKESGVELSFQNYEHPIYSQQFGSFLPNMSIIDLILNEGKNSLEIIKCGRRKPIAVQ